MVPLRVLNFMPVLTILDTTISVHSLLYLHSCFMQLFQTIVFSFSVQIKGKFFLQIQLCEALLSQKCSIHLSGLYY